MGGAREEAKRCGEGQLQALDLQRSCSHWWRSSPCGLGCMRELAGGDWKEKSGGPGTGLGCGVGRAGGREEAAGLGGSPGPPGGVGKVGAGDGGADSGMRELAGKLVWGKG